MTVSCSIFPSAASATIIIMHGFVQRSMRNAEYVVVLSRFPKLYTSGRLDGHAFQHLLVVQTVLFCALYIVELQNRPRLLGLLPVCVAAWQVHLLCIPHAYMEDADGRACCAREDRAANLHCERLTFIRSLSFFPPYLGSSPSNSNSPVTLTVGFTKSGRLGRHALNDDRSFLLDISWT